jgi:hypothetical protein
MFDGAPPRPPFSVHLERRLKRETLELLILRGDLHEESVPLFNRLQDIGVGEVVMLQEVPRGTEDDGKTLTIEIVKLTNMPPL